MADATVGLEEAVAAPGARATAVHHPPPAEEHESKRDVVTTSVETGMVGSMQELRIQTVVKNKDFDERIRALRSRLARLDVQRGEEAAAREKQLAAIREGIEGEVSRIDKSLSDEVRDVHDKLQASGVQPICDDAEALVEVEQEAYNVTVPKREEELSGPLVRRMLSERQAFEIDNTKVRARERRIVERFEAWEAAATLRHSEEAQDRFDRFCSLREAIAAAMAREDRTDEEVQVWLANSLLETSSKIAGVRDGRVSGDEYALERMANSMRVIQESILSNFGAEPESDEEDESDEEGLPEGDGTNGAEETKQEEATEAASSGVGSGAGSEGKDA